MFDKFKSLFKNKKDVKIDNSLTKEQATRKKVPWVDVRANINQGDLRYGFFDLDWNEYFIAELVKHGYGLKEDPEEELVDRWLRNIMNGILLESGEHEVRAAGFIKTNHLDDGRSEIS